MGSSCCAVKDNKYPENEEEKKNMSKAHVVQRYPTKVAVEAGKNYYWCSCGLSKNQPFCDGSHKGTQFEPVAFTPTETKKVSLCMCKNTGTKPYCDGTHLSLLF